MSVFLSVYITMPSEVEAAKIARALVEERLAACVNIVPGVRSFYRWEGQTREGVEVILMAKTTQENYSPLQKFVNTLHPHSCPCIVATPIVAGHPAYLEWLAQETRR